MAGPSTYAVGGPDSYVRVKLTTSRARPWHLDVMRALLVYLALLVLSFVAWFPMNNGTLFYIALVIGLPVLVAYYIVRWAWGRAAARFADQVATQVALKQRDLPPAG